MSNSILEAANAGDHAQASALLWEYIDERAADYAPEQAAILNMSQAERRAVFAEMAQVTDELHAETVRLQAERRSAITDADVKEFSNVMLREVSAMLSLRAKLRFCTEPGPYDGIPGAAERAAMRRERQAELDDRS
jgi:hypothetical protein